MDAVQTRQRLAGQLPATRAMRLECRDHVGIGHRSHAGLLNERGHAGMGGLDDLADPITCTLRQDHPAEPPAGHDPGFGEAVDHDDAVVRRRDVQHRRRRCRSVIDQPGVDLVGDQPDAAAAAYVQDRPQFGQARGPAGGVIGGIQDEDPRAFQHLIQPVEVQPETPVVHCQQIDRFNLRAADQRGIGDVRPCRFMQDDTLSGAHDCRQRHVHGCHPRPRHLHPRLGHRLRMQIGQIPGEGCAQRQQAAHIGVFRLPFCQRRHRGPVGG